MRSGGVREDTSHRRLFEARYLSSELSEKELEEEGGDDAINPPIVVVIGGKLYRYRISLLSGFVCRSD